MTPETTFVIDAWEEITAISRSEKFEFVKGSGKSAKQMVQWIPTLEKLEIWMEMQPWEVCPVSQEYFFQLITLYHSHYIGLVKGN